MLKKISAGIHSAQIITHPIQSLFEIAGGVLSILSMPFTGSVGLVNGIAGISKGSIDAAQDLVEASSTISDIAQSKPVSYGAKAHLTISLGVISLITLVAINPVAALVAIKVSAVTLSKMFVPAICLL